MAWLTTIITTVIDIGILWLIFYYILKSLKNNVKMSLIFKGVLLIIGIKLLSDVLNLYTVGVLLEYVMVWAPLALVIIFQPEISSFLENLGRTQLLGRHKVLSLDEREKMVYEVCNALDYLKKNRIGALIVIERDYSLADYINSSTKLYADITSELLISIFFPNNPLHDGGTIIQGDKISCAGAVFPTSMNPTISKRLGTRHRAALGVAEMSDAITLVVSEETGKLSIAANSELEYNVSLEDIRMRLIEELQPQKETFYDSEDDYLAEEELEKEGEEYEKNI